MSAPFVWDDFGAPRVPPAENANEKEHRRQLRDFSARVGELGFLVAYRPPGVLAHARVKPNLAMSPAVNNVWAKINTFNAIGAFGDPIFDYANQEYPHTALTIDSGTQNRRATALAGVQFQSLGIAQKVGIGIGLGGAPTLYIHELYIPAAVGPWWSQVAMPRVEFTAPASLWVRADIAADVVVLTDSWFSLELGARWR